MVLRLAGRIERVVKAPVKDELEDLVQLISQRVGRCLERQGLLEQDTENAWLDLDPAEDNDAMPKILGSSISYTLPAGSSISYTLPAGSSEVIVIKKGLYTIKFLPTNGQ